MRVMETEKFQKYGSFFFLLIAAVGVGIPILIALVANIAHFNLEVFLAMAVMLIFLGLVFVLLMVSYGSFTSFFVKQTAKELSSVPYHFNSSFKGRGGTLYIDVENGMIGFISAYNPKVLQIFNATRIDKIDVIASTLTGIRFLFYLDGQKIVMPTLLSNRMISTKSGVGAEAVSKANTFANLLRAAKAQAEKQ